MGKIIDAMERLVFGATAAEVAGMRAELAARRAEARLIAALERIATSGDTDADDAMPTQVCAGDCGQSLDPMDMEECGECFRLFCVSCFPAHEAICGQEAQEKAR